MERGSKAEQEKREERRKRRKRSQIGAYVTLLFMIAVMATGVVFGVKYITDLNRESPWNDIPESTEGAQGFFPTEESLAIPEETEVIVELTYEEKLDEIVNAAIEVMPLEDKVAGLFVVSPEAITGVDKAIKAGEGTRDALGQYAVGGLIYFSGNMQSKEQLSEMISNTLLYSKYPLFICVDEEGGSVSRVAAIGIGEKIDSARTIGQTMDAANAYQAGRTIGAYLAETGFNLNFAPVADLSNVANSVMEERAYGSEAGTVSSFVTSMVSGLEENNVTACLKHFPGIGSAAADTHEGLAVSTRSAEEFRSEEFVVFKAAIDQGAKMVMMGHIAAPSLTEGENVPCSLSEAVVTGILREELQFDGVIITDAMNMGAVSEYYDSDEAAILALKAGCDMILMPEDFEKAYNGVLEAVRNNTISEERINDALRRVYRIKYGDRVEQQ